MIKRIHNRKTRFWKIEQKDFANHQACARCLCSTRQYTPSGRKTASRDTLRMNHPTWMFSSLTDMSQIFHKIKHRNWNTYSPDPHCFAWDCPTCFSETVTWACKAVAAGSVPDCPEVTPAVGASTASPCDWRSSSLAETSSSLDEEVAPELLMTTTSSLAVLGEELDFSFDGKERRTCNASVFTDRISHLTKLTPSLGCTVILA